MRARPRRGCASSRPGPRSRCGCGRATSAATSRGSSGPLTVTLPPSSDTTAPSAPSSLTADGPQRLLRQRDPALGAVHRHADAQSALEYEIYRNGVLLRARHGDRESPASTRVTGRARGRWSRSIAAGNSSAASNGGDGDGGRPTRTSAEFRPEAVPTVGGAWKPPRPSANPRVHVLMGRVIVENVVVDDPATAAFLDDRSEAGENPVRVVSDAIEVGARVLAREQNAIGTEFVRNEFEKVSREVETAFTDKRAGGGRVLRDQGRRGLRRPRTGTWPRSCRSCSARARAPPCSTSCGRSCSSSPRGCARTCCGSSPPPTGPTRWPTSRPRTCARRATPRPARRRSWRRCASRWWR